MAASSQQPVHKVQMNSLVPEEIDKYVESLTDTLDLGKSELVHLFIAYFKVNFSPEEIESLTRNMLIFGEHGLKLREGDRNAS